MKVEKGELLAVVGQVGCGKSTLLATIMQESTLTKGEIERKGRVAYVEQDPFILSDTVQNNVLFGRELD